MNRHPFGKLGVVSFEVFIVKTAEILHNRIPQPPQMPELILGNALQDKSKPSIFHSQGGKLDFQPEPVFFLKQYRSFHTPAPPSEIL